MESHEIISVAASTSLVFLAVFFVVRMTSPLWDVFTNWLLADFTSRMRTLSMDPSRLPLYLRWWGLTLLVVGIVSIVLGIPLIGVAVMGLIFVAPRYILEYMIGQQATLLRDQMVGASTAMANAARAGLALSQALDSISRETPLPLAGEFRRIVQEFDRGRPLADALRDAKNRLVLDGFTLFTSSLLTCLDRGGRVTEALDRISKSLQESQRLERKLEADTATGRKVVIILIAFPLVFLLGVYFLDADATGKVFGTILGQCMVVAVLGLAFLAALWAKKILSIEM